MNIVDSHVHCSGREQADDIIREFDAAGVELACLLAPFLDEPYSIYEPDMLRRANDHLASLVRTYPERLAGFAVVNPKLPGALEELERAVKEQGLTALKTVPTGWYPYEDCALALYAKAEELGIPILFHTGIFIDGRSGRFCRPAFFEVLRDFPKLRVTLAHVGWPWTDEAIAVALIDLIYGKRGIDCMFRVDISWGPPPIYRKDVLQKALSVLGPELILFGSDRFLPCSADHLRSAQREVEEILDDLKVPQRDRDLIFSENARRWLGR